jgi:hypothetical protein
MDKIQYPKAKFSGTQMPADWQHKCHFLQGRKPVSEGAMKIQNKMRYLPREVTTLEHTPSDGGLSKPGSAKLHVGGRTAPKSACFWRAGKDAANTSQDKVKLRDINRCSKAHTGSPQEVIANKVDRFLKQESGPKDYK